MPNNIIKKIKEVFGNVHKLKGKKNASKRDLYYDPQTGEIKIKTKGGKGAGEPTGINIYDF